MVFTPPGGSAFSGLAFFPELDLEQHRWFIWRVGDGGRECHHSDWLRSVLSIPALVCVLAAGAIKLQSLQVIRICFLRARLY